MTKIEELKELTEKLQDSRDAFEAIAEVATDGFWDWDMETNYEYMSPRFWEMLGYPPEGRKHDPKEWMGLIHPDDLKVATSLLDAHVQSKGNTPYRMKCRYKHGSGKWIWILCRGSVIKWEGDKPLRMVGTHTYLGDCEEGDV